MTYRIPVLAIFATLLIVIAVLLPGSSIPDLPEGWVGIDKAVHALMFLIWAVAIHADFGMVNLRSLLAGFAACVAFSLATEVLQLFAEGRSFDLFDGLFDCVGFSIGVALRDILSRPLAPLARKRTNAVFS